MPSLLKELTPAENVPPHVAPWVDSDKMKASSDLLPQQASPHQPGPHEAYEVSDLPAPVDPWQEAPLDPYNRMSVASAHLRHAPAYEDPRQDLFHPAMSGSTSVFDRPAPIVSENAAPWNRVPVIPGRPDAVDPVRPHRSSEPVPAVVEHAPAPERQPLPPIENEAGVVESLRGYVEFYNSPQYTGTQHGLPTTARSLLQSLSHGRHDPSYRQHLHDAATFVNYLKQAESHNREYAGS